MKRYFALFLVLFAFSANAMISPEKTYQKVNKIRTTAKLNALNWDNVLADAALTRAKEIYEKDQWSHKRPDGQNYTSVLKNGGNGMGFDLLGENLARKFRNSDNMIKAWLKSPLHNKNLLQDFTDTGVATYGNVTVQLFGRRVKK